MPSLRPNSKRCRVIAATSTSRVRRPDVCCNYKRPESATSRSTSSIATSASAIRLPASTPSINGARSVSKPSTGSSKPSCSLTRWRGVTLTWLSTSSPIMATIPTCNMCMFCPPPCGRRCPTPNTATRTLTRCLNARSARSISPSASERPESSSSTRLVRPTTLCCSGGSASWCTTSASTAGGLRPATTLATTLPRYGSSRRRAHGASVRRLGRTRRQQGRWPEPCWQTTDAVHEALGAANGGLSDGTVRVAGLHGLAALGARKMYVVGLSRRHEQAYVFQPFGRQPSLPTAALHGEAVGRFLVGAAKLVAALVGVDPQLDG